MEQAPKKGTGKKKKTTEKKGITALSKLKELGPKSKKVLKNVANDAG